MGRAWLSSLKRPHEEKERDGPCSSRGEALRWWNGRRGDGLADQIAWEELFLLSLYQMTQSLPLVGVWDLCPLGGFWKTSLGEGTRVAVAPSRAPAGAVAQPLHSIFP